MLAPGSAPRSTASSCRAWKRRHRSPGATRASAPIIEIKPNPARRPKPALAAADSSGRRALAGIAAGAADLELRPAKRLAAAREAAPAARAGAARLARCRATGRHASPSWAARAARRSRLDAARRKRSCRRLPALCLHRQPGGAREGAILLARLDGLTIPDACEADCAGWASASIIGAPARRTLADT